MAPHYVGETDGNCWLQFGFENTAYEEQDISTVDADERTSSLCITAPCDTEAIKLEAIFGDLNVTL